MKLGERKTHCVRGHKLTDNNTRNYVRGNGGLIRSCKECRRIREKERRKYAKLSGSGRIEDK